MKYVFIAMLFIPGLISLRAQDVKALPLNIVNATGDNSRSLVVYITGDGGWNQFSQGFAKEFASRATRLSR